VSIDIAMIFLINGGLSRRISAPSLLPVARCALLKVPVVSDRLGGLGLLSFSFF